RLARGVADVLGLGANDDGAVGSARRRRLLVDGRLGGSGRLGRATATALGLLLGLAIGLLYLFRLGLVSFRLRLGLLSSLGLRSLLLSGRLGGLSLGLGLLATGTARLLRSLLGGLRRLLGCRLFFVLLLLLFFGHRIFALSPPAWPRNSRVGANSPSLCP